MSWPLKVLVFGLRELAKPTLEKCGEHIGNAVGSVLGRKIDPKHDTKDEKKHDPETDVTEEDRTG